MKRKKSLIVALTLMLALSLTPIQTPRAGEVTGLVEPPSDLGVIPVGSDAALGFGANFSDAAQSTAIILVNYTDPGLTYAGFTAEMAGADASGQFDVEDDAGRLMLNCSSIHPANGTLSVELLFRADAAGNHTFDWRHVYVAFQEPPDPPATVDESGTTMVEAIHGMEVPLYIGWNLVGVPSNLVDPSIEGVFSGNLSRVEYVYGFDNEAKDYLYWINGLPPEYQTLELMEPGKGYWVYVNENFTQTVLFGPIGDGYGHPLEGQTIRIGVTSSSTADLETTQPLVQIAEEDINEYVAMLGLDITFEFVIKDNQGTAAVALANTQEFKAMGIDLIIGHGWSSQCQASLSYVNENDMVLLSSSSTSPILAIPDDRLFRTCPTDFVQAPALAEMWLTWGVKGVLTMHRADAWGDGLWNIFEPEIEARGLDNLGRIRYAGEVTEFSSYLDEANQIITAAAEEYGGFEYVGFQHFSFAERRTYQVQAADYPNLLGIEWFTTESGGRSESTLREAGKYATQTHHFSSFSAVDEASFEFQSLDERFYNMTSFRAGFYTAAQYDACWLMAKSILETNSTDASDIADVLIPFSSEYYGLTGCLALDENGDRLPQMFDIWGLYEDPYTEEYLFMKFGEYDGQKIEVLWDDEALAYIGETRPALLP